MAINSTYGAGSTALELGGQFAGYVSSVQLPGYEVTQVVTATGPGDAPRLGANVGITPMQAQFSLSEAGPLLDWVLSLVRGKAVEQDGAVLVADHNFKLQRRVDWSGGLATELRLPALDAKDGKKPFELGLTWQPATVAYAPGGGGTVKAGTSRRKPILASNFRLSGLPFEGSDVARVVLPTIKSVVATEHYGTYRLPERHYNSVDLGELTIQGGPRSRDAALAYVQKVIRDGAIADSEYVGVTVEMLDASLKTVLATLSLTGCGLLRYEEDPIGTHAEKAPAYRLGFSVGQFDLKLNAQK